MRERKPVRTPATRRWMRRQPALGTAAAALAVVALLTSPGSASAVTVDQWAGTFGDAGNSMDNPGEVTITAANAGKVRPSWVSNVPGGTDNAPPVSGGVAYRMMDDLSVGSYLAATSVRTGTTLWTLRGLPNHQYWDALAVTGHYVIVAYDAGWGSTAGGLLLVDTTTRRLAWSRPLPPNATGNSRAGVPYTDGTRIYISGADNWVNTYRLSDGALLWMHAPAKSVQGPPDQVDGFAVANGVVYSAGEEGLIAWDAATGRRLWGAPAVRGRPVVIGSHVYGITATPTRHTAVGAFPVGGCGASTCTPLWRTNIGVDPQYLQIGGVDPTSLFATYQQAGIAYVTRLAATTGQLQWTAPTGDYIGDLVRGGNVIWIYEEYIDPSSRENYRIVGFSANATSHTPLAVIPMTDDTYWGFPQHLSIVNGSLLQKLNGRILAAYRVPGT